MAGQLHRKLSVEHAVILEARLAATFVDCRIPAFNHIDGDLKKTLMSFSESRPVVAAYALGVTRAAMDFAWARLGEIGIVPDYNATITQRSAARSRCMGHRAAPLGSVEAMAS